MDSAIRRRPTRAAAYRAAGMVLLFVTVLAAGCSTRGGPQQPAAGSVTVRVVDEKDFARTLEQYRGKAVLVDYWATWCTGCVARFPQTVALDRRLRARGLVTISVSFDDPEDEAKVLKFLRSQGADFDNFISRYGGGTESVESFQLEGGTLPHVQLFGRDGKLYKSFSGEDFSEADIERAVAEVLGKPATA